MSYVYVAWCKSEFSRSVTQGFPSDSARNSRVVRAHMKSLLRFAREPEEGSLSLDKFCTLPETNIAPENEWLDY